MLHQTIWVLCLKIQKEDGTKKRRNSFKLASHLLLTSITEEWEEWTGVIRMSHLLELVFVAKSGG